MNKLRYWLRNLFGFTQGEINGFFLLCLLMILILLIPLFWKWLYPPHLNYNAADHAKLDQMVDKLDKAFPDDTSFTARTPTPVTATVAPYAFDPNQLSSQQWQALGTPRFIADRIIKYRSKGGKFRVKNDVQKIYGFPKELYNRLYAYIQLPDSLTYARKWEKNEKFESKKAYPSTFRKEPFARPAAFDINAADTAQLEAVRGIGPALAKRIIKYRDGLGGFVSESQIREVYGLDSLVVDELLKRGFIKAGQPTRRLYVNTATEKELDTHPYISPRLAKLIIAYRLQHGKFNSPEDLAQVKLLDQATLTKLKPYLSFE
jgi:DNA uptake protein ComE-like DNA-binding protein